MRMKMMALNKTLSLLPNGIKDEVNSKVDISFLKVVPSSKTLSNVSPAQAPPDRPPQGPEREAGNTTATPSSQSLQYLIMPWLGCGLCVYMHITYIW